MILSIYGDSLCALVTAAVLASIGHQISLHVPQGQVQDFLSQGAEPYPEPGLHSALLLQQAEGRLTLADFSQPVCMQADAVFLAFDSQDYELALDIVQQYGQSHADVMVVNQSTFSIGSSEKLAHVLAAGQHLVYLPDFMQEGAAIQTFSRPNKIILGCGSRQAELLVREIFRPLNRLKDQFMVMSLREAEFTKLAVSGMLATRVSFMNDLAGVADALGVDIEHVRMGMGSDPRIGEAYLYPGCGFGGQSFSREVMSLASTVAGIGAKSRLLEEVLTINELQKEALFRKLWRYYDCNLKGRVIGIWGASFKPNTNRIDNAPILKLLDAFLAQGATVRLHDPKALKNIEQLYGQHEQLILCHDQYDAATGVDALLLVTEWKQYWSPDYKRLLQLMNTPFILDGRNIYDPNYIKSLGFDYMGVGRA
jgi:UDPglucose 6-dehydrogenase